MSGFSTRLEPAWPADFAAFTAQAAGRSFAHGERFREVFAAHGPGWTPRLIVVRDASGAPCAAWLGYVERRLGGAWIRSLPFGAPAGPLFAASLDATRRGEAARALWSAFETLARDEGWLGGDITFSGPAADDAALRPTGDGTHRTSDAHVIALDGGVEAWRASLRKRARQQFTKAERLGVTVGEGDARADLDQVYAQHVAQAEAWGVARGVRPIAFYRALLAPPSPWRMWVARAEGRVLCGVLVHVDPAEAYVWWSGSSPEARPLLAFPYVLECAVRECGSRTVNLGFSGGQVRLTDFKEQLGAMARPLPIFEPAPRPRTPYHALLAFGRDVARRRRVSARAEPAEVSE